MQASLDANQIGLRLVQTHHRFVKRAQLSGGMRPGGGRRRCDIDELSAAEHGHEQVV